MDGWMDGWMVDSREEVAKKSPQGPILGGCLFCALGLRKRRLLL